MRKTAVLAIILLTCWGCATFNRSYKLGTRAAFNKDWDKAIDCYQKASEQDPYNPVYKHALLRAKLAAAYFHLNKARELASHEKTQEALAEYEKALSYGVLNKAIADEAKALSEEKVKEGPKEVKIELPVKLKVSEEKIELRFPVGAPLRSIFQALGKHARINIIFDDQFRDVPFSIELVDLTFEQALNLLCLATRNFYTIVDERTVVISPDMPQKRVQYELNAIKTFYLSNINADEIRVALQQMLRTQYRQPQIYVDKNLNSLTIKDTAAGVELAEKIIRSWDKAKGEVIIDLDIMEVSRIKLRQLGMELTSQMIGLRYGGGETTEDLGWFNLKDIDFSKKENFQIAIPAALLQFLESDVDTRVISQPRLRGLEGEAITYLVGDQVPIPQTTFQPFAAGGISQQPVVSYTFKDVGIDVKIKPRIHAESEITLELEIKIKSLAGAGVADIPIITTREVKNTIRLRDGETNLLAGLLKDEERTTHAGIAGLKNIPILGGLFSSTKKAIQQTDVVLTITPHIVRTIPVSEQDLKPLWVGPEGVSTGERVSGAIPEQELIERRAKLGVEQEEAARRAERGQSRIFLTPASARVAQNQEFRVNLNLSTQGEIANMSLSISFDAQLLKLKDAVKGGFLGQLGAEVPFLKNIDNASGSCIIGFSSPEVGRGAKGTGVVATLIFEAQNMGEGAIAVTDASANTVAGETLSFETGEARVFVR